MTLSQLKLDDRDFQTLVSEARLRIAKVCPEWTEHNVSDPGITLIELFAWMTDILIYRVNRIPENVEIALLNLLAVERVAAAAATAEVRFMLNDPPRRDLPIPKHVTEVATASDERHETVVFRVAQDTTIPMLELEAMALARGGNVVLVPTVEGKAIPTGAARAVFSTPPAGGDALYLGTRTPLDGLVVRVSAAPIVALGAAITPGRPPWIWDVSPPAGEAWARAEMLRDTTGGFNLPEPATIELQLPRACGRTVVAGKNMYWLRCRLPEHPVYLGSPELDAVSMSAVGVATDVEHASAVELEILGTSDGTPSQAFRAQHPPTLALGEGEHLEVREPTSSVWEPWEQVSSFELSDKASKHFVYDAAHGEVRFGPSIRVARVAAPVTATLTEEERPELEAWKQYGKVPPAGSLLRLSSYHHGGGFAGNVPANSLVVLRTPIAGVATVTNPKPATGGVSLEDLRQVRQRAALEMRARQRAVTPGDYELLARSADRTVARVYCERPEPGHAVPVRVLPKPTGDLARFLSRKELTATPAKCKTVGDSLRERCPIATTVHVTPVALRAVTVVVEVEPEREADPVALHEAVAAELFTYLNPVIGGRKSDDDEPEGWEWGRRLTVAELHPVVRAVDGVRSIIGLRAYETELLDGSPATRPSPKPLERWLELLPSELIASGQHQVRVKPRQA